MFLSFLQVIYCFSYSFLNLHRGIKNEIYIWRAIKSVIKNSAKSMLRFTLHRYITFDLTISQRNECYQSLMSNSGTVSDWPKGKRGQILHEVDPCIYWSGEMDWIYVGNSRIGLLLIIRFAKGIASQKVRWNRLRFLFLTIYFRFLNENRFFYFVSHVCIANYEMLFNISNC